MNGNRTHGAERSARRVAFSLLAAALVASPAAAQFSGRTGFESMIDRAIADKAKVDADPEVRGSGPYPAMTERDIAFPNATIYRPADLARMGARKLGVVIWGNGGCANDGASAYKYLAEVASHGYLIVAAGKPLTGPLAGQGAAAAVPMTTTVPELRAALDWALAENGRPGSPYYGRIDPRMVAASGHSCGAMQAIVVADDPRVKTLIVNSAGVPRAFPDRPLMAMSEDRLKGIRQPAIFFFGGESDIVWKYGQASFDQVPGRPAVLVSREYGHGLTMGQSHGGEIARLGVAWLEWQLRGDKSAAAPFVGPDCGLCKDSAWTIRKKGLR
jgi:hypothetical protein